LLRIVIAALLVLAFVAAGVAAGYELLHEDTIAVTVGGVEERIPEGTTAGDAAERLDLRPAAGDLLDVQGAVLRRGAFPGSLLVNGRAVPLDAELEEGDRVASVDGRDRKEAATRYFVRVAGGMPGSPQFTLARTPGRQELERGKISGKVALVAFHPSGPARSPRAVALTFDDGPSRYTRRVLAVLERMHARATFFVVGNLADRFPRLVRRELDMGMAVGNHSYSHPYRPPFDRQPPATVDSEIERGAEAIARAGRAPSIFRPPGGSYSPYVLESAAARGQRIVLWSVDPEDWRSEATAAQVKRRVLDAVRPGSIVLLHDGGGDQSATVEALPGIIRGLRDRGLRLVVLDR
jgi:peptidoglycan/xylan/chitin deacetylase (PgdA/CDA1 family)/sulfur carrier protein ThiS